MRSWRVVLFVAFREGRLVLGGDVGIEYLHVREDVGSCLVEGGDL